MVQVTFMGTGAAFSTNRRTNISLLVQEGDTNLLVECGPTVLYQLDQAGSAADQITHIFISHRHGDHLLGLPLFLLMYALGGTPKPGSPARNAPQPLTIFGNKDVIQAGRQLSPIVYPELEQRLDSVTWVDLPVHEPDSVESGSSFKLSTFPLQHSPHAPVSALRLDFHESGRSIVYTGDTMYNEKIADLAAGCDLLVHEANYSETLQPKVLAAKYGGHSTARQVGHIAARAGCGILALVHLSPDYAGHEAAVRAEAAEAFDGPVIIPNDGATIYL